MTQSDLQQRFSALVSENWRSLWYVAKTCARRVPDGEAEDLLQAALELTWRSFDRFDGRSFKAWVARTIRNRARAVVVGNLRRQGRDAEWLQVNALPASMPVDVMLRRQMNRALVKLDDTHQRAFEMVCVLGLEHEESAGVLGCPPGSSMRFAYEARNELQKRLKGAA